MSKQRIAYIGCGAVVERSHLPSLTNVDSMAATVLVDFNKEQRSKLAKAYDVNHQGDSISTMFDHFDIGVIATPSASHYTIAKELLNAGKHVLVEKPLSMHYHEALELVDIAKKTNLVLAVSLVRRYLPHFQLFKTLMRSNVIGKVQRFHIEEGGVFNWPVQAVGFFKHDVSGGGVLMDHGAHLLDACLWWLGDYDKVDYFDDSQGGVEAECSLSLTLQSGAQGTVLMSRLRNLDNIIRVEGDQATVQMNLGTGQISLSFIDSEMALSGQTNFVDVQNGLSRAPALTTLELFEHQYKSLNQRVEVTGAQELSDSLVSGDACLESIRLIEACYENRQQLSFMAS